MTTFARLILACVVGLLACVVSLAFLFTGRPWDALVWFVFLAGITSALMPPDDELRIIIRVFSDTE